MAEQSENRPGADGASCPGIWVWDTGISNSSVYNVACLSGSTLHVRLNLLTARGKNKIVRALEDGVPPETAIPGERIEIPLESVRELRFSEEADVLEIHWGANPSSCTAAGRGGFARSTRPCGKNHRFKK